MAVSCDVSGLDLQNSVDNYMIRYQETNQAVSRCNFLHACSQPLLEKMPLPVVAIAQAIAQSFRSVISLVFRGFSQPEDRHVCVDDCCDVHGRRVTGEMKPTWVWVLYWFARKLTSPSSRADEFHLVSIMSICIVKLSLYCKAMPETIDL